MNYLSFYYKNQKITNVKLKKNESDEEDEEETKDIVGNSIHKIATYQNSKN